MNTKRICSIPDCGRPHDSRGFCKNHAKKARRLGIVPIVQKQWIPGTPMEVKFTATGWDVTESDCWEWRGARARGYGILSIAKRHYVRAHRASYEIHNGPIPEGLVIMHACDNPPCVNPAHLSAGTTADNVHDMWAKGRAAPVLTNLSKNYGREPYKFTAEQVAEIRRRHRLGASPASLRSEFEISRSYLYRVLRNEVRQEAV